MACPNKPTAKEHTTQLIRDCMEDIVEAAFRYEPGSREFDAVISALKKINIVFSKGVI